MNNSNFAPRPAPPTALAPRPAAPLTNLAPAGATWTPADIALIRALTTPAEASDEEFKLLLYMAHQYHLDPLLKQIYCVKYKNKPAQIFAGRDGFLAIAQRSGAFDGMETAVRVEAVPWSVDYTAWDNGARHTATFQRAYQYVARATVWNKAMGHPIVAEVWEEEYSTGQNLWATKPRTMIAKVAECQALRRAFNISGLYDPDEMTERTPPPPAETRPAETRPAETRPAAERKQLAPAAQTPAGEPVNTTTGEIVEGEMREVPPEEDAQWAATDRHQPAPVAPAPAPLPPGGAADTDLLLQMRDALAACGLDYAKIMSSIEKKNHAPWAALPATLRQQYVTYYQAEAAKVQQPAQGAAA